LKQGLLVVISGPSGAGKGSVIREIVSRNENVCVSISCTTRPPRPEEADGVEYHFIDKKEFKTMLRNGEFLEFATVFDNYYGTPLFAVDQKRCEGKDVVLEIDVQGALEVRRKVADALLIFIMPPSMETLRQRLTGRNTETDAQIEKRFTTAYYEMRFKNQYDYVVVNDQVERAAQEIMGILEKVHKEREDREGN